jgi:hypothetical membrane protein
MSPGDDFGTSQDPDPELVGGGQPAPAARPEGQSFRHDPSMTIPWWAVAAAGAAPVLLIGGFLLATAVQPATYDPVRDTISALAEHGAVDSWLMTSAIAGVGLCYLLAALGLQPAGRIGRVLLAGGGVATLLIAVFRVPRHGYSLPHELAVIATALTCCTWPAFASRRPPAARLLTRAPSFLATGVLLGLAAWYTLESHGPLLGIAERCAAAAPALWLLAVAVTTRRARARRRIHRTSPVGRPTP